MRRIAFLLLALPVLARTKDSWSAGAIKVLATDEWCGRPGIPDWPDICGPPRSDSMTLFNGSGGAARPANPYTQILEISAPDATYIVRRTSLDGGLHFHPGAKAQFAVDGKHLILKFDREDYDRRGQLHLHHDHDRLDILEVKKK